MSSLTDQYLRPSSYASGATRGELVLQTAAGMTPQGLVANPVFFQGMVKRPDVAAAGLLALVDIASTRYFNPVPGGFGSLDPLMTANGDRLRCEALSACHGVYARLDLHADLFGNAGIGLGTTNIDIHAPLARALGGMRASTPMYLSVGPDEVAVDSAGVSYRERKVLLPERWVRSLAETQSIAAGMACRAALDAAAWRRFVHGLPTSGGSGAGVSLWLLPATGGLRQTRQAGADAICLAGSARLAAVRRVLHLVQSVRVYGPPVQADTQAAPSAWEFHLPGARLTLMLSPQPWRGFSGEGALLEALSQADRDDALTLGALLAWESAVDQAGLGAETGYDGERIRRSLQVLATSGHLGFDHAEEQHFHRQLPFVGERLHTNYPRLEAARLLLASGAVSPDGERFKVQGSEQPRWVTLDDAAVPRCTCTYWSRHQGTRGPCKHVLAAQMWRATQAG